MTENEQPIKRMDLNEFYEKGYLQEVNRRFFHPLGLALEMAFDDNDKVLRFGGVWDYRDDPEGMYFAQPLDPVKVRLVKAEQDRHRPARQEMFGSIIQPWDWWDKHGDSGDE